MIEMKNISAGYNKKPVIEKISLTLPNKKLISLIGPNASGKSTLLKTATGILPKMSGEIIIDSEEISVLSQKEIAKKISYLSQENFIPDMTVGQLVLHGRFPHLSYPRRYTEKDRKIVCSVLNQTGIEEFSETPLASLSGGIRQVAYIAMALAQNTDYIFLDEPTTYLDISHQISLMKTLKALAESGKTIVTVMHDLPLAFNFSDSVIVLKDGKLIACDTPENICKSNIISDVFDVSLKHLPDEIGYVYEYCKT